MAISKPILPPRAGYVEKVDENGNHIYVPTSETATNLKREQEMTAVLLDKLKLQMLLDTILGVNETDDEQTASGS